MKILHILRSKPDDVLQLLIKEISSGESSREIQLYADAVNYDQLVEEIFQSDRIISWW